MLLPFPTRIPVFHAFVFTCVLVLVQLMEHTDPRYSALVFCFFMLTVFAFNTTGGLARPSGGYILFFAVLGVGVGTVYKAILGQPAQTYLSQPLLMMSVHVALMSVMLVAAFIKGRFVTTQDGMAGVLNVRSVNYGESSIGCLALFFIMTRGIPLLPGGGGQILRSLNIVNPFLALSVFLGTLAAVRNSGGRRSTSAVTLFALGYIFYQGILAFSKQGMFTPVACWLIAAAWARFRLRPFHIMFLIAFAIYAQLVLAPLSARRDEPQSDEDRLPLAVYYLTHYSALQKKGQDWVPPNDIEGEMFYYGKPEGIWDRLSMLPNDSVLISFSDQGHYYGLQAIRYYFENWIPHIIDPGKLQGVMVGGNAYMHEMGELADADTTTGISFSPSAELYHIAGWFGILVVAPPIYLLLFASIDAVCGDLRRQPWGLGFLLGFAHVAPEAGIGGAIAAIWLGNVGTTVAIFGCGYVTPVLGMLFSGGGKERLTREVSARTPRALQAPPLTAS